MLAVPRDRRAERYAATRAEILDAAWDLVRSDGLVSFTLRDLAARVGMRAPSLYVYFPSKHAIYDAMFEASNELLLARLRDLPRGDDPAAGLRARARVWIGFCVEDPARYQLLYQRTIPGFDPSPESYAPAVEVVEDARLALAACGITDPGANDAWNTLNAGLAAQQNSNEPGGDRWVRLIDAMTTMFLAHYAPTRRKKAKL